MPEHISVPKRYFVIGGDKRFDYLAELFSKKNIETIRIRTPQELKMLSVCRGEADCAAILPYPLSPDGVNVIFSDGGVPITRLLELIAAAGIRKICAGAVKDAVRSSAESIGLSVDDYSKDESLLHKNALCSAEGAIHILMKELPCTVHGSVFTVIGYGRIGRILSCKLRDMGATVRAIARRPDSRALMEIDGVLPYSFVSLKDALAGVNAVINTVPATVLTGDELRLIEKSCIVLDVASSPGGVDREAAEKLGLRVIWALSIPGKYSPCTAAEIIANHFLCTEV